MAFLELRDVSKQFGPSLAVEQFNLAAERGEFISFLGPSGCGKTTTLRMIAGFEAPSAGQIVLDGAEITHQPASKRGLGMVFQSYALFPNLNVTENIAFGLRVAGKPAAEVRARVDEMLRLIGLIGYERRFPYQLSGGQQQRVALARALAIRPRLLLLDEPLSALDAQIRVSLRNEIRAIQRQLGITTIFVTHDQEEALALADRVVVMHRGRIEQVGTPRQIYNQPQTPFVAAFVGTLNTLRATVLDPKAGTARVSGQLLTLGHALASRPVASEVSLALRPEAISLAATADGPNRLRGTVEDVIFQGALVRLRVSLGDESLVFDLFNQPHLELPQRGAEVLLHFPPEACLLLDAPTS